MPEALRQERRANLSKDDPEGFCLPAGVPRISPFPYKIVQTPTLMVYLDEGSVHNYRQFFMDGRAHPKDADQLWMGHSILASRLAQNKKYDCYTKAAFQYAIA